MWRAESQKMEQEINGCQVTLFFSAKPVDGVIGKVQCILSNAYEERVQNDLMKLVSRKLPCG